MARAKKKSGAVKIEEPVMTSEDPSSGFIRFETNVSNITPTGIFSPVIEVMGTPWRLLVQKSGNPENLLLYLYHRLSDCDIWTVDVSVDYSLMNSEDAKKHLVSLKKTFDHKIPSWGPLKFVEWKDVVNTEKGFIKDGKIVIECRFTLSNFVGIRTKHLIDFSDPKEPSHDVTLVMEGGKVYVNKAVLAVQSPVFKAMFYGQFTEKDKKEIELKDIDRKEFIDMLNMIYPSYEKITDAKVDSLLKLADRFQIGKLTDEVEQFIIDSTTFNICSKLRLSDDYRLVKLQDHCLDSLKTVKDITDLKTAGGYNDLSNIVLGTLMKKVMKLS